MNKRHPEHKIFNVRLPTELWFSIKTEAMRKDLPLTQLIEKILNDYDKKIKKKLTQETC